MKSDHTHVHEIILFTGLLVSILALPFSILLCHLGILIILLNWIAQRNWSEKWETLKKTPTVIFFVLYFTWLVIGTFYSEDLANAWFNVEKKFTFAVVPVVLATSTLSEKNKNLLYQAFVLCCGIGVLICLGSAIQRVYINSDLAALNFGATQPAILIINPLFSQDWQHFSYVALASGIGIHPTYFAIYIIFCICIVVLQYNTGKINGYTTIALIGFFILFLALLSTRITFMVILIIALVGLIRTSKKVTQTSIKKLAIGGTFVFLFLVLTALNPISLYREFQEINATNFDIRKNTEYTNSTEIRLSLWWAGLKTVLQSNPIVGSGSGDTQLEMNKTLKAYSISNSLNSHDPHNQFINTFISTGLIGLILLLGCYLYPVRQAWLQKNFLQLSFIGLVLLVSLTESFLESQKGIVFFVLFQSLSLTGSQLPHTDPKIAVL